MTVRRLALAAVLVLPVASCGGTAMPAFAGDAAPETDTASVVTLGPGIFAPNAPLVEIGHGGKLCGPLQIKDRNGLLVVDVTAGACESEGN